MPIIFFILLLCRNLFPKLNHYILREMEVYGRTLLTDNTGWMMDMDVVGRWIPGEKIVSCCFGDEG